MTLLQSWADSLTLLKPKNLKLFLLVTFKAGIDTYKVLVKNWLYVFLLPFGCCIVPYLVMLILPLLFVEHADIKHFSFKHLFDWIYQAVLLVSLVASRPSLEQKDGVYFRRHMIYFLPIVLLLIGFPKSIWPTAASPLYFFAFLFFFDSPKRISFMIRSASDSDGLMSLFRAIKMIVYNLPLLIIVGFVLNLPWHIVSHHVPMSLLSAGVTMRQIWIVSDIVAILLAPFIVCLYTNIYIKKLHDQFDLYFKQPS